MIGRTLAALGVAIALGSTAWLGLQHVSAQQAECRYFSVRPASLNVSKEPRGDAVFIDVLDKGEVVCVTREQKVGDRDWVFIAHKVAKPQQLKPVQGWANGHLLSPASAADVAAAGGAAAPAAVVAPAAPPAAAQPPAAASASSPFNATEAPLRYSEPVPFGPFPVNGRSIEQLAQETPMFGPIDGLPEALWKKTCSTCHKWDRAELCEQGAGYAKNPAAIFRHQHPYGGAYKTALMQWAKSGCQ